MKSFYEWVNKRQENVVNEAGFYDPSELTQLFLAKHPPKDHGFEGFKRPRLKCRDGFAMSVQAGEDRYSTPREDYGPYSEVEVGGLSEPEELLEPYKEPGMPTGYALYGYVPIKVVDRVIEKHGGLA